DGPNPYVYVSNQPINFRDPSGLSRLVFRRNVRKSPTHGFAIGSLELYDKDNKLVGSWVATNEADSRSNGRWPNGYFPFVDWHHLSPAGGASFGYDDAYGVNGVAIFYVGGRDGDTMGVHAGQANNPNRR